MTHQKIKALAQKTLNTFGYALVKTTYQTGPLPHDMDEEFQSIYEKARPHTMTSVNRMYELYKAVQYLVKASIPGDIVECGVWKGGSSIVAALTLISMGDTDRRIWLYDTFEGMPEPGEEDIRSIDGLKATQAWSTLKPNEESKWIYSPLEEVQTNIYSTGYPKANISFVKGKVEETIPANVANQIALLRLDTDWYESTYHELQHLFPRVSNQGVLIIDDYGWWKGSRTATDQYFSENNINLFLHRIDDSGRLALKLGD